MLAVHSDPSCMPRYEITFKWEYRSRHNINAELFLAFTQLKSSKASHSLIQNAINAAFSSYKNGDLIT